MPGLLKSILFFAVLVVVVGILTLVGPPKLVFAEAGPGGGGGSSGCASFSYSTCYGAVWRYYKSSSNAYKIPNVGGGNTVVSGCASSGGFFAYVLVNSNGGSGVRSWKIGPVNGFTGNRSIFFGGWTNYRVFSKSTDSLPTNPSAGDYSWYSAKKAFQETKKLGQNSGYAWNGSSSLGWFCYKGSDFNLEPVISGSPDYANSDDSDTTQVALRPLVNNTGATSSSNNVEWRVVNFVVASGGTVPSGGTSSKSPAQFFGNGANTVASAEGKTFSRNITSITVSDQLLGSHPVGTRVCYALSLKPITQSSSSWRHSTPFCVVIAKSPKIQVHGGDIRAGSYFTGQTPAARSNIVTSKNGSWGEYAIIATGLVKWVGSGSAFAGDGASSMTLCGYSFLTFTNAGTTDCRSSPDLGQYRMERTIPPVASVYPVTSTSNTLSGAQNISGLSGEYKTSGVLTLNGGQLSKGQSVIINTYNSTTKKYGGVTISGNLTYSTQQLTSNGQIPQLVIIAGDININENVTRVDAWLSAEGTLNTCSNVARKDITDSRCKELLTVNGPVMAREVQLWRTAGYSGGNEARNPGEIFNLRPDAYLWGISQKAKSSRLETVYERELPPRY
jgi:hypothetical protein